MKVFHASTHYQHQPRFEVFDGGEKVIHFESPERMERILSALQADGRFEVLPPEDFGLEPILAVHDRGYLDFLRTAFDEWLRESTDYEKTALLPATFPPAGGRGHIPASLLGRAGYYMMDLSAPIVAGTYRAALDSAYCALGAAQALEDGAASAFALCRPPGHHAGKANCGGYCYINNAAVAANRLSQSGPVALLDVDYHAGNGTQDIFYERADVLTLSIHGDPGQEYPYYLGYADETGAGAGRGFHRNFPLPFGVDDQEYLSALEEALGLIRHFQPGWLVVSAGMDIYGEDPLGKTRISRAGIAQIGARIAALGLPTLIVMEGGYNNEALGENVRSFLDAWESR
jgi:acetoin utilization deacetylase AcuC-like enzyme